MKRWIALLAVLVLALLVWRRSSVSTRPTGGAAPATAPAATSSGTPGAAGPAPEAPRLAPPERSSRADALNSPKTDIRADLQLLADILDTFRTNFPRGGNPVGSNAEITAVLTGQNRLRLALIPADHPAINREGELCDRWGTPFFFHAESASKMGIRSAGPDRKMWSADDVEYTP